MPREQRHHFFISTFTDWVTGDNMIEAIMNVPRNSKIARNAHYLAIWRVPLPRDADYRISNYAPEVEGAELVYLDTGDDVTKPDYDTYKPCGIRQRKGPHWVVMQPDYVTDGKES